MRFGRTRGRSLADLLTNFCPCNATALTALNTDKATLLNVELLFVIVYPFVKTACAQGFASGGLFTLQLAELA